MVAMRYLLLLIISLTLISCDSSSKKNVESCIKLGVEKKLAEVECKTFDDLEKKIQKITNDEIDKTQNLLHQAELINKKFDNYTKNKFKFNAEVVIDLNADELDKLFTSKKVTNKPIFAHHVFIKNDTGNKPYIFVENKKWRINEENYEFLTPTFSGKYELRNDKTKNKLFTQFFNECSKTPYCKFSVIGTIDAVKPKVDETSVDNEWEGWIDIEDFSFNKFIHTNPERQDIEKYVLREIYKRYNKDREFNAGYIQRAIYDYIYES